MNTWKSIQIEFYKVHIASFSNNNVIVKCVQKFLTTGSFDF